MGTQREREPRDRCRAEGVQGRTRAIRWLWALMCAAGYFHGTIPNQPLAYGFEGSGAEVHRGRWQQGRATGRCSGGCREWGIGARVPNAAACTNPRCRRCRYKSWSSSSSEENRNRLQASVSANTEVTSLCCLPMPRNSHAAPPPCPCRKARLLVSLACSCGPSVPPETQMTEHACVRAYEHEGRRR